MEHALKKRRAYGPDVTMASLGGTRFVEKTYKRRGAPVRTAGSLLVCWERYIYSKLQGIHGIPELMPSSDRYTLITRFMGGQNLRETSQSPGKEYFHDLEQLIRDMHSRGVIHLDLRNRRNYGIDDTGKPYIIDFASSIYIPFSPSLVRLFSPIDWMGYAKVKQRLAPSLITEEEAHLLALGNTLSSWWLPTKALRILRDLVKRFRG